VEKLSGNLRISLDTVDRVAVAKNNIENSRRGTKCREWTCTIKTAHKRSIRPVFLDLGIGLPRSRSADLSSRSLR
jgi:hypothetical protein